MTDVIKIRLGKAAQEFNVGIETIIDLLKKKGYSIENNANAKLDTEMYHILVKEYDSERIVKENANKKNIDSSKPIENKNITVQNNNFSEIEDEKPIFIKDNIIEIEKPYFHKPKIIGKIELESNKNKLEKKVETKNIEPAKKVEAKIEETKKEASLPDIIPEIKKETQQNIKEIIKEDFKNEIKEPIKEEVKEEITESIKDNIKEEIKDVIHLDIENEEKEDIAKVISTEIYQTSKTEKPNIKHIGFIDLSTINEKVKPDRKTKEEIKKEFEERKSLKLKEREDRKNKIIADKKEEEQKQKTERNQHQEKQKTEDSNRHKDNKQDNVIKPDYKKLEGPKIMGKVELDQTKKPIAKSSQFQSNNQNNFNNKKKRKRIFATTTPQQTNTNQKPTNFQGKYDNNKQGYKPNKFGNKSVNKDFVKPEITEEDIDKQIKETLARLGPAGKSKTSKHRKEKRSSVSQKMLEQLDQAEQEKKVIKVAEFLTANELATMMEIPVTHIISTCMSIGLFVSINQRLDAETINLLADEFGYSVSFISADSEDDVVEEKDNIEDLVERSPIVTVMGHVDHGKTSLLDYIRKTNVIAGEAGGITQHVGAYEVLLENDKKITFLDTPGHEAFTAMRARGAKITDIAIIVIAADDSIMPQTVEAINHAQAAGVPMIFAINKIDKPNSNPEKIREALANMNILVEEWGGNFQCQEISAKKGINIQSLLDKILIESEILELKANPQKLALGTVIESSLDKGRGYVAKILVQNGTLNIGDFVVAGTCYGKVKAMYNERNNAVNIAGPSVPVLLLGLSSAPQAGDTFKVYKEEHEAKAIATKRSQLQREQGIRTQKHITLDEIGRRIAIGDFKELNIIVKGDVDGSIEALSDSLLKLSTNQVQVNVIHKSVGMVSESDVLLASASNAIIVAFQVRPSPQARKLAETEEIDIRMYSIIYNAINEIKDAIEGMLSPEIQEKIVCNLEIREVFNITKVGNIAGCMCLDGKINRNTKVRIIRNGIVIYSSKLGSLKRFKDDVKEVYVGQDCGLNIDNYNDIKVGDIIEGYDEIEVKRTIK